MWSQIVLLKEANKHFSLVRTRSGPVQISQDRTGWSWSYRTRSGLVQNISGPDRLVLVLRTRSVGPDQRTDTSLVIFALLLFVGFCTPVIPDRFSIDLLVFSC